MSEEIMSPALLVLPSPEPIHPSIVVAIASVAGKIEAVKKSQYNRHDSYNFASTDDIYAAVNRAMAEVGLVIMALEVERPEIKKIERTDRDGKTKTSQWGQFSFGFIFATKEATWSDPRSRRTILVQILGPQTFQAAESYVMKSLLRSLFKIPTGDMDLDAVAQADSVEAQEALNGKHKRKSSAESKRDGTTETFNAIRKKIGDAQTIDDLRDVKLAHAEDISTMPERWSSMIDDEMSARSDDIRSLNGAS